MNATVEMKVWVGCLACYNNGNLNGEWMEPSDGPDWKCGVTDLYPHEETWVMDHEGLPIRGECSPYTAARIAETVEQADEHERGAFLAWLADSEDRIRSDDAYSTFEDRYRGEWDSFRAYAEDYADSTDLLAGVSDEVQGYFDWESWSRNLAHDYTVIKTDNYNVYVFSDN